MKAIFDTRAGSGYDDDIITRYHFPQRYLSVAQQSDGDWIIYREPRRNGGREGYVAVAQVSSINEDRTKPNHFYASITNFLPFDGVVPLKEEQGVYFENRIQNAAPSNRGVAIQGKSVREISNAEFASIVRAGLCDTLNPANAIRLGLEERPTEPDQADILQVPIEEQERRIMQILTNRKIRDAAFRGKVLDAYDGTCAITGLRMVNGGGRTEAQAAHIWSVADGGPDVIQNGIALSGTIHWLFDRHLISLTDEYGLLVSHNKVPTELQGLFDHQMERIRLPADPFMRPHPRFIRKHREKFAGM